MGIIRINGVMTTNFRRLQPLLVGVMERQAQSPTARVQAALPLRSNGVTNGRAEALYAPPGGLLPA